MSTPDKVQRVVSIKLRAIEGRIGADQGEPAEGMCQNGKIDALDLEPHHLRIIMHEPLYSWCEGPPSPSLLPQPSDTTNKPEWNQARSLAHVYDNVTKLKLGSRLDGLNWLNALVLSKGSDSSFT